MNNKDMSRELIVTLLQRQIDELMLMTEGFMDMESYPEAIIQLAQLKNDEIREYLDLLSNLPKGTAKIADKTDLTETTPSIDWSRELSKEEKIIDIVDETDFIVVPKTDDTDEIDPEELEDNLQTEDDIDKKAEEEVETDDQPEAENEDESEVIIEEEEEEVDHDDENEVKDNDDQVDEKIDNNIDDENDEKVDEGEKALEETEEVFILEFEDEKKGEEIKTAEAPKTTLAEKLAASAVTRNEVHNRPEGSILSNINNTRITDIRQAISIGDRFRFQRELFRGNGEDMNKTLNYINQLATLHEVESFLNSKYNWPAENPAVEDFFQIIKRKF